MFGSLAAALVMISSINYLAAGADYDHLQFNTFPCSILL
jgi:hypothetical protein